MMEPEGDACEADCEADCEAPTAEAAVSPTSTPVTPPSPTATGCAAPALPAPQAPRRAVSCAASSAPRGHSPNSRWLRHRASKGSPPTPAPARTSCVSVSEHSWKQRWRLNARRRGGGRGSAATGAPCSATHGPSGSLTDGGVVGEGCRAAACAVARRASWARPASATQPSAQGSRGVSLRHPAASSAARRGVAGEVARCRAWPSSRGRWVTHRACTPAHKKGEIH